MLSIVSRSYFLLATDNSSPPAGSAYLHTRPEIPHSAEPSISGLRKFARRKMIYDNYCENSKWQVNTFLFLSCLSILKNGCSFTCVKAILVCSEKFSAGAEKPAFSLYAIFSKLDNHFGTYIFRFKCCLLRIFARRKMIYDNYCRALRNLFKIRYSLWNE